MYPEYVRVGDKQYKINTSYKVALECNEIAERDDINDYKRALGVIYKLFGREALYDRTNREMLLEKAIMYLKQGKETKDEVIDTDFVKDMPYIKASFMSDYHIDLNEKDMHFYEFCDLLNGLSNSELGNCCVFNRIRNLRNLDLSEIKDVKTRAKLKKAKDEVAIKKKKPIAMSKEQKESAKAFYSEFYRKE
jgi:hypothetical protein